MVSFLKVPKKSRLFGVKVGYHSMPSEFELRALGLGFYVLSDTTWLRINP